MVVFDLDDTLVPVMGPIQEANRAMHQFVNNNMAMSSSAIHNDYHSTSQSVMEEHPLIAHDYTDIRNISLTMLCEDNQDDIDMVDKAVEVRNSFNPLHCSYGTLFTLRYLYLLEAMSMHIFIQIVYHA